MEKTYLAVAYFLLFIVSIQKTSADDAEVRKSGELSENEAAAVEQVSHTRIYYTYICVTVGM
jgi:hypothetical protein